MSDGMSDARALDKLAGRIQAAAVELAEAIQEADDGHRGLTIRSVATANLTLEAWGLRLEKIT